MKKGNMGGLLATFAVASLLYHSTGLASAIPLPEHPRPTSSGLTALVFTLT